MKLHRIAVIGALVVAGLAPGVAARAQSSLHDTRIVMSDGVALVGDVDLPPGEGPFPVILQLTPYGRLTYTTAYVANGFAHVNVDVRGTGRSAGVNCITCAREQDDVVEVIDWVARQPWSTGNVGMIGGSYSAFLQLLAAAKQPPALKAIVPRAAWSDPYRDGWYQNGLFNQSVVAAFSGFQPAAGATGISTDPALLLSLVNRPQNPTPLELALAHPFDDDFYKERAIYNKYDRIKVPALFVGGWFDMFTAGTVRNFNGVASVDKRLIMGPWTHRRAGGLAETFPEPYPDVYWPGPDPILQWYEHYVAGIDNGVEREPRVQSYDIGTSQWTASDRWPLSGSSLVDLHLSGEASGSIESLHDGALAARATRDPVSLTPDSYLYDATSGVAQATSNDNAVFLTPFHRFDQRIDEMRSITYTTAALEAPIELAGPIELDAWASTTAADADIVVRMSDVGPDGTSLLLTSGFVRLSQRTVDTRRSKPGQPWLRNDERAAVPQATPVHVRVPIDPVDTTLAAGHRLRISISSADVAVHQPLAAPSINTILHDRGHPSTLFVSVTGVRRWPSVLK
ncbi:MAG: uncharacterized protein QOH79_1602 [Acidimicrobiaceae bacterium]